MSSKSFTHVLVLFLLIFHLSTDIFPQPSLSELEKKADEICAFWKPDGPGGVIGIVDKGILVFSKAYGLASLEYDVPNTTSTIFNIASVSKQFTAFSMVLLEQKGKLSIDDDIRKYLPEVPDFGQTITIRHLLNHVSGLRNFQNMLGMAGWREGDAMTNEDLLRFTSKQKELNYPVGSEYLYCNTGFVLVTFIVERVTGMSFQDWTKANIFEPLGMNDTGFREDMEAIHKRTATSYNLEDSGTLVQPLKYWTYMGNGNVYTTVDDLAKWINNFRIPSLGAKKGLARLIEKGILTNGDTLSYALGIGVNSYRGLTRYTHGGSVGGYRSQLTYFPETETGFIAISNYSGGNPGGIVTDLTDYYLNDKFEKPKSESKPRYPHVTTEVSIENSIFEKYTGAYMVEGITVELFSNSEGKFIEAKGVTPVLQLSAASDTSFFVQGAPLSIYISTREGEEPDRIIVLRGDEFHSGYKIDPDLTKPENLSQYAGIYYSPELETQYTFQLKDNILSAYHQRHGINEIFPLQKDRLVSEAFHLADIKVVRWSNGEIKGIKVSNGRVRDIWFEKR